MKALNRWARADRKTSGYRVRNLSLWAERVQASGARRTSYPLTYLSAISFWVLNRGILNVNRSNARARLKFERTQKRRT